MKFTEQKKHSQKTAITEKIIIESDSLGGRIKWKRKSLGLSQPDLAKQCDVPTSSINNAERGRVVLPRYIKRLSEVLDTSIEWLVNGEVGHNVAYIPETISLLACDTPVKPDNDVDYYIVSIKKGERLFTPKGVEHISKISKVYIGHNN